MPSAANYLGGAAYWTERLRDEGKTEEGFDWLLAGDDAGFKQFIRDTVESSKASLTAPDATEAVEPLVLHLGPGSSTLSLWMRGLVTEPANIIHYDFAESAKELGERWERERWPDAGEKRMRWMIGDLLALSDVQDLSRAVADEGKDPVLFDVLVDKGTLDAVSCAEDLTLNPETGLGLRVKNYAPEMPVKIIKAPVYSSLMVALNLATITRPGAAWVMLSYSGTRFDAFTARINTTTPRSLEELASRLWRLEVRRELEAEQKTGESSGPKVYHWLYLLRRTDVLL